MKKIKFRWESRHGLFLNFPRIFATLKNFPPKNFSKHLFSESWSNSLQLCSINFFHILYHFKVIGPQTLMESQKCKNLFNPLQTNGAKNRKTKRTCIFYFLRTSSVPSFRKIGDTNGQFMRYFLIFTISHWTEFFISKKPYLHINHCGNMNAILSLMKFEALIYFYVEVLKLHSWWIYFKFAHHF